MRLEMSSQTGTAAGKHPRTQGPGPPPETEVASEQKHRNLADKPGIRNPYRPRCCSNITQLCRARLCPSTPSWTAGTEGALSWGLRLSSTCHLSGVARTQSPTAPATAAVTSAKSSSTKVDLKKGRATRVKSVVRDFLRKELILLHPKSELSPQRGHGVGAAGQAEHRPVRSALSAHRPLPSPPGTLVPHLHPTTAS